jgi:predicted transcriptional regulator
MSTSSPSIATLTRVNSTVKDLFVYLYNLSPLETDLILLLMLNSKNPMTLEQVANEVNRDKSTVFRSLQKLVSLGIVTKETRTIKEGGYYHVYGVIDTGSFKIETEKRVRELERGVHRILKKFEEDLDKMMAEFYKNNKNNNNKSKHEFRYSKNYKLFQ